jgi:hypothetical protein
MVVRFRLVNVMIPGVFHPVGLHFGTVAVVIFGFKCLL